MKDDFTSNMFEHTYILSSLENMVTELKTANSTARTYDKYACILTAFMVGQVRQAVKNCTDNTDTNTVPVFEDVNVILNGEKLQIPDLYNGKISYDQLCYLAKEPPVCNPSITYSAGGEEGIVSHGQYAPLVEGIVYNVYVTGNS